ncbi:MAG: 6-phosphofructokinase [Acutalibacteraceae bacterium]|nr:6-phosphofructokinase [Acutalibacteraceae bacterium]
MAIKTIGVLTSGGDAPGMNAAVRSVVRTAISMGLNVKGIHHGYNGLIEGDIFDMNVRSVSDIIHRGGTVLYTARSPLFKTEEGVNLAVENCKKFGIDGIVVIGGDGSFRGARDLSLKGIPCIGVPGTIDNDIASTEYTIGFDTAMNTAMEMVDKLRDTTQSHERCSVVEVMGRHAGWLALQTGVAVGATAILVPEVPFDFEKDIINEIKLSQKTGKMHYIIVVAEGVGNVHEIAKLVEEKTGIVTRATVLGHVQRGGSPTVRDRVMASGMGYEAVRLLKEGIGNRVIAYRDNQVVNYDIYEALNMEKPFDINAYKMAYTISI